MKDYLIIFTLVTVFADLIAQPADQAELVTRIVHESAQAGAGETVYVFGGAHSSQLMEEIIEAYKAVGAAAVPLLSTDKMGPFKNGFLTRNDQYQSLLTAQVWIIIDPLVEASGAVHTRLTDHELIQLAKTENEICMEAAKNKVRIIRVLSPYARTRESLKLDTDNYQKMILQACTYDDFELKFVRQNVARLQSFLAKANSLRIRTRSGTNFSCLINNRPIIVNDGSITEEEIRSKSPFDNQASLPEWSIQVSVLETSANGKVVVPRTKCDDEDMFDVSFNFVKGKLENFSAAEGAECFRNKLSQREGPKDLMGSISFGFNPELKLIANDSAFFCIRESTGIIWLTLGSNDHLGGKNPSGCGQFSLPLVDASLEIDGKMILGRPD